MDCICIETAIFSFAFAVIAILSNFSWVLQSPKKKLKTMVMQKFGGVLGNFGWFSEILAFEATLKSEYKKNFMFFCLCIIGNVKMLNKKMQYY